VRLSDAGRQNEAEVLPELTDQHLKVFGSHHLQCASLAARPVELFSISSQNQKASCTRQGLSAASPNPTSRCGQDYRLPGGGRSASSLRTSRRLISVINEPTLRFRRDGSLRVPTAMLARRCQQSPFLLHRSQTFAKCRPAHGEFGRDHLQPDPQVKHMAG
jgi:hypothetical protein